MPGKNTGLKLLDIAPVPIQQGKKISVLLVDDHEMVRLGMSQLLGNEARLRVCGEAADAPAALRLLRSENPDMAIVDISLQEGNGLELIKQMKATHPDVRIIVLSMHEEEMFAARALRAGAVGYVSKHAPARTIIMAIDCVLGGKLFLSEKETTRILTQATTGTAETRNPIESLSDRELDIFRRIGLGETPESIAQQLHLSAKTVSTYRDRIRAKLNLDSAATLARHACLWVHENG